VALKQFGQEGDWVAGDVAGYVAGGEDSDKPEVRSGTEVEFGAGTVVEVVGGAWLEAFAASVVAGGKDGAEAVEKLLHFY